MIRDPEATRRRREWAEAKIEWDEIWGRCRQLYPHLTVEELWQLSRRVWVARFNRRPPTKAQVRKWAIALKEEA